MEYTIPTEYETPCTVDADWVYGVSPSGGVDYSFVYYIVVSNSYGSPDRRLTDNGYFCNQYGYIAYDDYGVQYSYGYRRARIILAALGKSTLPVTSTASASTTMSTIPTE